MANGEVVVDYADLLKSGLGAIIGFCLAQLLSVGSLLRDWWVRPLLKIECVGNNSTILSHGTSAASGEMFTEEIYGFRLRNVGRTIALGVRFQLLRMDYRDGSDTEFSLISDDTYELRAEAGNQKSTPAGPITLVPKACALVRLATWTDGQYDLLVPSVDRLPHYFVECCEDEYEGKFLVAAFAENADCVTSEIIIRAGGKANRPARKSSLLDELTAE